VVATQPHNVTIIGKVTMMAASNVHLLGDRGDKMAAGSANQSPFPDAILLFMVKERWFPVQVGQVFHVLP
jgi:hypothetical protein